jgi:hypothetical protein
MTPDRSNEALTDWEANETPLAGVRFGDYPGPTGYSPVPFHLERHWTARQFPRARE